jgi:5-methylcytosine-specific restriction protein A
VEQKQNKSVRDARRIGARHRGYTPTWERVRKLKMQGSPLCERCLTLHRTRPALLVHHKDSNARNNDMGNLMSLCRACHDDVHGHGVVVGKPSIPVTLVCGPPGSGKSTWVEQQRKPGDVVIDLDVIKAKLAGVPIYQAGDEWIMASLAERNRMLAELPSKGHVWFILSGARADDRRKWQERLGAEVVVMEVSPSVCKDRIMADDRRPELVKRTHVDVVDRWWARYVARRGDTVV